MAPRYAAVATGGHTSADGQSQARLHSPGRTCPGHDERHTNRCAFHGVSTASLPNCGSRSLNGPNTTVLALLPWPDYHHHIVIEPLGDHTHAIQSHRPVYRAARVITPASERGLPGPNLAEHTGG